MRTKKAAHTTSGRAIKNSGQKSQTEQAGRLLQQLRRQSTYSNKDPYKHQQPTHQPSFHRRIP